MGFKVPSHPNHSEILLAQDAFLLTMWWCFEMLNSTSWIKYKDPFIKVFFYLTQLQVKSCKNEL